MKRENAAPPNATSFAGLDFLPTTEGIWIVGFGPERGWMWAGAVIATPDSIKAVKVRPGELLGVIQRGPDGEICAAGDGFFRREGQDWRMIWFRSK